MSLVGFRASNHPQQVGKNGAHDPTDDRGTRADYIAELEERFGVFDLDVAAAPHNAKAAKFYVLEDDGLSQPWSGNVWCNPPYSNIGDWVEKAWDEWCGGFSRSATGRQFHLSASSAPKRIVMLLPSNRVEQGWWQDHVEPFRDDVDSSLRVEFLRGRMRFDRPNWTPGPKGDRPPFGCCLLIWEDR